MPSESSNIKVVTRVRPLTREEEAKNVKVTIHSGSDKVMVTSGKEAFYSLDGSFPATATNAVIFQTKCEALVKRSLDGYNVTLLAFGSTGSGKSHLMTGVESDPGIVNLVTKRIFQSLAEKTDKDFLVTAAFVDILDESMRDLLNPHNREMHIRQHPYKGVYVEGLSELVVHSDEDLSRLYEEGVRAQTAGSSDLAAHRYRSTSIFTISIEQKDRKSSKVGLRSTVSLVDLAGIETSAVGSKALLEVLSCLGDSKNKAPHTPYRNSQVTRLLQDSLGGNCFTLFVAVLSPTETDHEQTLKTLEYCQFARNIKNTVRLNIDETSNIISELRSEITKLRTSISNSEIVNADDVTKMQDLVKDLEIAKKQTWNEREKLSQKYEHERKINLSNKGMYEWVTKSLTSGTKPIHDNIVLLQKEKDQLSIQSKETRTNVDSLKDQLQTMIADYSQFADSGKLSESETKKKVSAIHETKEKLKRDGDHLKKLKDQLAQVEAKLVSQTEAAQSRLSTLKGNSALRQKIEVEEMQQLEARNKALVVEELEKVKIDVDGQKAAIQTRAAEGRQYTSQEGAQLESGLVQMKGEATVITLQLQVMRQEKQRLQNDLASLYKVHADEIEIQQLQHFQTFREYREMFGEQKRAMEARYQQLLDDSIQDAVFLSSRNSQLTQENLDLQQNIAVMKDKICKLEGNKELK